MLRAVRLAAIGWLITAALTGGCWMMQQTAGGQADGGDVDGDADSDTDGDTDSDTDALFDEWAVRAGGEGHEKLAGVAVWSDGSSVVAGEYNSSSVFGEGDPNETVLTDGGGLLARYNPDGTLDWVRDLADSEVEPVDVAALEDGASVVVGSFIGTVVFGHGDPNATQLSVVEPSMFLARFDAEGELDWAVAAGASTPRAVDAFTNGSAVVTGSYSDQAVFGESEPGDFTLDCDDGECLFVARFTASGPTEWVVGASSPSVGRAAEALGDGDCLVIGEIADSAVFGTGEENETEVSTSASCSAVIARYDSSGVLVWAKEFADSSNCHDNPDGPPGLSVFQNGSAVVVGAFDGYQALFGDGEPNETLLASPTDYNDYFVAYFAADGLVQWARRIERSNSWGYADVVATSTGDVAVVGAGSGILTFAPGTEDELSLTVGIPSSAFVGTYDPQGTFEWAEIVTGSDDGLLGGGHIHEESVRAVPVDEDHVVIGGRFEIETIFWKDEPHETLLESAGEFDDFLARYAL